MKLTRISHISGKEHTMEIPLTQEEFNKGIYLCQKGSLIQNVFPTLNDDQREFIMIGITPEEWDEMFKPEEGIAKTLKGMSIHLKIFRRTNNESI